MTRKTYIGTPHRESVSGQSLVTVCDGQKSEPLPLRLDLFNHSPTGFGWGYGGSGPAQLALALLADFLGDDDRAIRLHQDSNSRSWRVGRKGNGGGSRPSRSRPSSKSSSRRLPQQANEQDGAAGAAPSRAYLSTGGPDAA